MPLSCYAHVLLRFAQLLLHCLWSRRYQVLDALIGSSQYTLLPSSYRAVEEGIIHVEGTDHALDDHGHDHDHGPHDIVVVAQRWAIVTGASRGIGRAFVRKLSDQGFSLLCIDRDDAELEDTVEVAKNRLERGWRGAVWPRTQVMPTAVKVGCDVAHVEDAIAKIEQAIRTLPQGSLRLLVNNVGMSTAMPSLLAQHDAKEIELMVHTNLLFAMQLTRALWPELTVRTADRDDDRRSGILFSLLPRPSFRHRTLLCTRRRRAQLMGSRVLCVRRRSDLTYSWTFLPSRRAMCAPGTHPGGSMVVTALPRPTTPTLQNPATWLGHAFCFFQQQPLRPCIHFSRMRSRASSLNTSCLSQDYQTWSLKGIKAKGSPYSARIPQTAKRRPIEREWSQCRAAVRALRTHVPVAADADI